MLEAVAQRRPVKKIFSKILQNSLKDIRAAVFTLIQFQAKDLQLYWNDTLPAKAFRTPILQNADGQLLLKYEKIKIVASDKLLVPVGKFREKAKTR